MEIYSLLDYQFWLDSLYFILIVGLVLFYPGWLIIRRWSKLGRGAKLFLAPVLGLVSLTLVAYLSGQIGNYALVYGYVILLSTTAIIHFIVQMVKHPFTKKQWRGKIAVWWQGIKRNWLLVGLICLGLLIQMPAIITSGWRTNEGVRFQFTNSQDGLMHLGFINAMTAEFPPLRLEVNDELTDYHYFSDLTMAQLARLGLPVVHLFFHWLPVFLSILTTGLIYYSILLITRRREAAAWVTLVFLLAGDGGYLLSWYYQNTRGWEMATFDNGADQFLNLPMMFAKPIFFSCWLLLNHFWQTGKKQALAIITVLATTLVLFKVYWWIFLVGGWAAAIFYQLAKKIITAKSRSVAALGQMIRELLPEVIVWLLVGIVGYGLLNSITTQSDGLTWVALAWPRTIASPAHLNLIDWSLREQTLLAAGSRFGLWRARIELVIISLIFVDGARLLGLYPTKKTRAQLGGRNVWFLLASVAVWTIVGFNFMQTKGGLNTFNFLILAAVALLPIVGCNLANWWSGSSQPQKSPFITWLARALVIVVLLLLAPRTIRNDYHYWRTSLVHDQDSESLYSTNELELLAQLRRQTTFTDLIIVLPTNSHWQQTNAIAGLAGRRTFLSNQGILATHNYEFDAKKQQLQDAFQPTAWEEIRLRLRNLGGDYLLLTNDEYQTIAATATLVPIFQNDFGVIINLQD